MGFKRFTAIALTAVILLGFVPQEVRAMSFYDTNNHWSFSAVSKWSDYGIVRGNNGYFMPDNPITRGEMAVMLDRLMGYKTSGRVSFYDLDNSWYTDAIMRVAAAGIIQGSGGMVRPKDNITRQEAVVMICRALGIAETQGSTSFYDDWQIASWAKGYVRTMASRGMITGVGGNNFMPNENVTRASVVKMLDGAVGLLCTQPRQYAGGSYTGAVVINTPGVTLKNMTISGDLIIAEGVADGTVTLEDVNVTGITYIRGGGKNSVNIGGSSRLGMAIAEKNTGETVTIKITNNAKVDEIKLNKGTLQVSGTVPMIEMYENTTLTTVAATIQNLRMMNTSTLSVDRNSKVTNLYVEETRSSVDVAGNVSYITVGSSGTYFSLRTQSYGKVYTLKSDGDWMTVRGESNTVSRVEANGSYSTISTVGTYVVAGYYATGVMAGSKAVNPGSSATVSSNYYPEFPEYPPIYPEYPPIYPEDPNNPNYQPVSVSDIGLPYYDQGYGTGNVGKYTMSRSGNTAVITVKEELESFTRTGHSSGTGRWIGVIFTIDATLTDVAYSSSSWSFSDFTWSDMNEAVVSGASGNRSFVWWVNVDATTTNYTRYLKPKNGNDNTITTVSINVIKMNQAPLEIIAGEPQAVVGDAERVLNATGGSGNGLITYSIVSGGNIASITGDKLKFTGVGEVTVRATKGQDVNYGPVNSQNFVIKVSPKAIGDTTVDLTAPAKGQTITRSIGDKEQYTTSIKWFIIGEDGKETECSDSVFKHDTVYKAKLSLKAKQAYKWPETPPTITCSGVVVADTAVAGGDVGGNTLSFELVYPKTDSGQ